jgi:hypothetical protein
MGLEVRFEAFSYRAKNCRQVIHVRITFGRQHPMKTPSSSKPNVAFTRSRRMRGAVSGSPLRNRIAASSSSTLASALDSSNHCLFEIASKRHGLISSASWLNCGPAQEFSARCYSACGACAPDQYISLLPALGIAAKQQNHGFSVFREIDPVTGTARPQRRTDHRSGHRHAIRDRLQRSVNSDHDATSRASCTLGSRRSSLW